MEIDTQFPEGSVMVIKDEPLREMSACGERLEFHENVIDSNMEQVAILLDQITSFREMIHDCKERINEEQELIASYEEAITTAEEKIASCKESIKNSQEWAKFYRDFIIYIL